MKYALICPNQLVTNGYYIAQVAEQVFPVGEPTYWLECADNVVAGLWYFDTTTNQITLVPIPIPTAAENKATASSLLAATDWTSIQDVASSINNPHLTNQSDFIAYRSTLRQIAVTPVAGILTWPTVPVCIWS